MFRRMFLCLLVITPISLFRPTASLDDYVWMYEPEAPWSGLPDNMDNLCPNTDICSTKLSNNGTINGPPCCRGCSCETDCGLTHNCCYPELDVVQTAMTDIRSCLHPMTRYRDNTNTQPINSYYMVDRCSGDRECECGRQKVAEWGTLYPVFSKSTGLVYKNPICADCNNVTDGQVWEPVLVADKVNDSTLVNAGNMLISKIMDSKDMTVLFLPPDVDANRHALDAQVCYQNLIDFCVNDDSFRTFGNFTDHELCESGLRAPVWYNGHYYANIFCVICKLNDFSLGRLPCSPEMNDTKVNVVAEIDKNVTLHHQNMSDNPVSCTSDGAECTEVLCPAGRHRYNDECVLVHTKWQPRNFHTILAFSPKSNKDKLSANIIEALNISVAFPDQTEWKLSTTVGEKNDGDLISHVYAELVWEADGNDHVTPADILQSTYSLVQQSTCSIEYAGRVYTYKADFSKHAYLVKEKLGNITYYEPLWLALKRKGSMTDEVGAYNKQTSMVPIFDDDNIQIIGKSISISKLFFCSQIELANTDFKAFYNGTQLYYKKTGKYFLDGEFALNKRYDGSTIARICLEDSGYHLSANNTNNAYRAGACIYLQFVIFFICLLGYCIQ